MTTRSAKGTQRNPQLDRSEWIRLGLMTAAAAIVGVLVVQAVAIAIWPDIALFRPLDNYVRSAIFTLVPVLGATTVFAWLAGSRPQPAQAFIRLSLVVLFVSIIPDYALPDPNKTLLASSATAFLHVVAGAITILMLLRGYRSRTAQA